MEAGLREAVEERAKADYRHWPAVRATLLDHPHWVQGDSELLSLLNLRPAAANLVEFGPAALARLETAKAAERTAREDLEALAQANYDAHATSQAATLDLLAAHDAQDLAQRIDRAARERFGLSGAALAVEHAGTPKGWQALPTGLVDQLLGSRDTRFGPPVAVETLMGEGAEEAASLALIRMALWPQAGRPGGCSALLVFVSDEAQGFTPDMGAEVVTFLARVIERMADRWPPLI